MEERLHEARGISCNGGNQALEGSIRIENFNPMVKWEAGNQSVPYNAFMMSFDCLMLDAGIVIRIVEGIWNTPDFGS